MQNKEPDRQGKVRVKVLIDEQVAEVERGGEVLARFPVSTSKFGLGSEEGSFCTPLGRFVVAEKIGAGLPLWSILRGRVATGELATAGGEEDMILTRILRLQGLEEGNANTWERYIYFHGTNQEDLLGSPASHGCIRLGNVEMERFFELVPIGAEVEIVRPEPPFVVGRAGEGF